MAKKNNQKKDTQNYELLAELNYHYQFSQDDMDKRKLRKNGWDDTLKAYFGKLPNNWPYQTQVTDPVIRTAILEKTSRMFAGKLRGTVVPREGADAVSARIQNAILDFQWDYATEGGSMLEKIILSDIQTRIFGASFGLCYWDIKKTQGGETFETNEFKVLDNRDVFVDYQSNHIRNANWVQVREWVTFQQLKEKNDGGQPIYQNLDLLESKLLDNDTPAPQRRDNRYTSIVKQLRSLEDRVGQDIYYPTIELVTEYRRDRWITFAPRFGVILRDIKNPYKNMEIPVVMLRYYPVGDDVYGESEVESVLPLYRAINATLCGFIDQMNLGMRPPIKVAQNAAGVRMDTIQYGPNALWLTGDSVNNIQEHVTGNQSISLFQNSYTALKNAFNTAMGEASQSLAPIGAFAQDRTATEIRTANRQTVARDNYNQIYLEEFLKDIMMKWISNNQQFLFSDPSKESEIIRIVGKETIDELEDLGLGGEEMPDEVMFDAEEMINERGGDVTMEELETISEVSKTPKYPVMVGGEVKKKLETDEFGKFAKLFVTSDDMRGFYDYIPDVKSMAVGVNDESIRGRNQALSLLLNPGIDAKLQSENVNVKISELLKEILADNGVKNPEKFFEEKENEQSRELPISFPGSEAIAPANGVAPIPQTNAGMAGITGIPSGAPEVPGSQEL